MTLQSDNVAWLKGRAGAVGESVSELLDQLVSAARHHGGVGSARSVVGTIDIEPSDAFLEGADAAIQATFDESLALPIVVRDGPAKYRAGHRGSRKARG